MNQRQTHCLVLLLLAVVALSVSVVPKAGSAPRGPKVSFAARASGEKISLLLRFGLNDQREMIWNGEFALSAGRVVHSEGWHFFTSEATQQAQSGETEAGDHFLGSVADTLIIRWECKTRQIPLPPRQTPPSSPEFWVRPVGVVFTLEAPFSAEARVVTERGNFSFLLNDLISAGRLSFLDGSVQVERVPGVERVTGPEYEDDQPSVAADGNGNIWIAWLAYRRGGDEVLLQRRGGAASSEPIPVDTTGDHFGTAVAVDSQSRVWVVWSAQIQGNWDLYARAFDPAASSWSRVERLTEDPGPDIFHKMVAAGGRLYLVWQGFRSGQSDIWLSVFDQDRWLPALRISTDEANDWEPAVAADPQGRVWIAWDGYASGNYDVYIRSCQNGQLGKVTAVAPSPRYQARAGIACDAQGRVWIAWEESGANWGKDYGSFVGNRRMEILRDEGQNPPSVPLYFSREVKVACLEGSRFSEPLSEFGSVLTEETNQFNGMPALVFDGDGRLWLFYRHRTQQWPGRIGGLGFWEIFAQSYAGNTWSPTHFLPNSIGGIDGVISATLDSKGRLWAVWSSDQRRFMRQPGRGNIFLMPAHYDVFIGQMPAEKASMPGSSPRLKALDPEVARVAMPHPHEKQDVRRMRAFRIQIGRKNYGLYRGDLHRHTEISYDGASDGSLTDAYRYALDAALLDYLLVTDHNYLGGYELEYLQWRIQKFADLFLLHGSFTPLFGYERSVPYPNGHRNIVFTRRGIAPLTISPQERSGAEGAGALYAYLRKNRGISMPHTSATGGGTDWRDNDPELEPLVEIYQGCRNSYEYEGAPKAASEANPDSQIDGLYKAGFVWNAWAKGYKLGVQASSDHYSTHLSYACLYAEANTREGLMDAIRKRHSYGATDNMVVDFRIRGEGSRQLLMGDSLESAKQPVLFIHLIGTSTLDRIDIIKNNRIIYSRRPDSFEARFTHLDNDFIAGQHYYYIRALQKDGQVAWSSPIWLTGRKK